MAIKRIRLDELQELPRDVDDRDILAIVSRGKSYNIIIRDLLRFVSKIDDNSINESYTWSSYKINDTINSIPYVEEAPQDGIPYGRKDGVWTSVQSKNTKVVDSLPLASLEYFELSLYSIADSAEFLCVANTTNPQTDDDVFWIER